ncbi:MAG: GTP-binding protein [Verrucomicrobiota bacterium JB024]|nr:GTP-binding protein [Verrucomicrobiota bacterium JB024]
MSGFLGAGKTTLLNHILKHSPAERLAVLVNDLGEVNIDASLIRSQMETLPGPIGEVVELTSGCICCSIQTELMDALLSLYERYHPTHILIEATGVAEPKSILETIYAGNYRGHHGTDFLRVANMVTVVDGANLEQYLSPPQTEGKTHRTHLLSADPRKPLQELLMEQIECADVLVLNKAETLNDYDRDRLRVYLHKLNAQATVWEASFGQIDVEALMFESRFSEERTLTGALWRQALLSNDKGRRADGHHDEHASPSEAHGHGHEKEHSCQCSGECHCCHSHSGHAHAEDDHHGCSHEHGHHHDHHGHDDFHHDYGLETFVFNARRPFNEARFFKTLRNGLPGVIRAKGFYWVDRCPDRVGLLSIAGKILRTEFLGTWWYTMVEQGQAPQDGLPDIVREAWLPEVGDRRQEIVLIGIDMDRAAITQALSACFIDERN